MRGKKFRDEATLKAYDRPRLFEYTYWTSFWEPTPDPDSIQVVTNEFIPVAGGTKVVITRTNIPSAESRDHSEKNLKEHPEQPAASFG